MNVGKVVKFQLLFRSERLFLSVLSFSFFFFFFFSPPILKWNRLCSTTLNQSCCSLFKPSRGTSLQALTFKQKVSRFSVKSRLLFVIALHSLSNTFQPQRLTDQGADVELRLKLDHSNWKMFLSPVTIRPSDQMKTCDTASL